MLQAIFLNPVQNRQPLKMSADCTGSLREDEIRLKKMTHFPGQFLVPLNPLCTFQVIVTFGRRVSTFWMRFLAAGFVDVL